jgi:hypothetical protein
MNKQSLATILGVALLGLAKSKGSSARRMPLDDYVKRSTGGTGKVRVDFTFKYKPFWEGSDLRCNFNDELWDAQGALDVWNFIHDMSQDMDIDDYESWYSECYGDNITHDDVEHYHQNPDELYDQYLDCSESIEKGFYIFRNDFDSGHVLIKNYLNWSELEEYVSFYNLSSIQVYFYDDESEQSLGEEEELEFEQTEYGWEPIGFDRSKYESLVGPRSTVEGYIEFDVNDIEDLTFLKARKHEIKEYISKMLEIAYDAFRLTEGASVGRIEIVSIKFSDFWDSNKSRIRRR